MNPVHVPRFRVVLERDPAADPERAPLFERPEPIVRWLRPILGGYDRKVLGVIYVDALYRGLGYTLAYIGTHFTLPTEPRGVFVPALLCRASSVIVFQNNLADWPAPDLDDLARHRRLRLAGERLGIPVLDYLIVDDEGDYMHLSLGPPVPGGGP